MKLRELLNLTEQAPQPPQAAPVPAQSAPSAAETPEIDPTAQEPGADTAPTPSDPSEYDFTRDFRAFEDSKNKAEAAAKKKLLDKMNKMMLGKKIVANASRGYGQPKTDYTLEKVKKISVEFWYKDWVVIAMDDNDKKFFLTPGVNVKIEPVGAEQPQDPQATAPEQPQDAAAAAAPVDAQPEAPEAPNGAAEEPAAPGPEAGAEPAPAEVPSAKSGSAPNPAAPAAKKPGAPSIVPEPETPDNVVPVDFSKKKKKLPMAAEAVRLFKETIGTKISSNAPVSVKASGSTCIFEVAAKYFKKPFDTRDFMLESRDVMHNRNGSVEVQKIGLNYQFTFQLGR